MSIVSITRAAKLSGKSIRTIQRHLSNGKLSFVMTQDDTKGIDTSELIRVYGHIKSDDDATSMARRVISEKIDTVAHVTSNDKSLEHQIELLKLELNAEKRLSNERLQTIDTLKSALKLLEHKQTKDDVGNIDTKPDKEPEPPLNEAEATGNKKGLLGRFKKLFH